MRIPFRRAPRGSCESTVPPRGPFLMIGFAPLEQFRRDGARLTLREALRAEARRRAPALAEEPNQSWRLS